MKQKKTTYSFGGCGKCQNNKEQSLSQFLKLGQIAENMTIRKKYIELVFLTPCLTKLCGMSQS